MDQQKLEQGVKKILLAVADGLRLIAEAVDEVEGAQAAAPNGAAETPAKRTRKSKAETAAAPAPTEPVSAPAPVVAAAQAPQPAPKNDFEGFEDLEPAKPVTAVDAELLRNKLVEYAQKHTKEQAFGILAKYNAKKVNDLSPENMTKVYSEIQAGL